MMPPLDHHPTYAHARPPARGINSIQFNFLALSSLLRFINHPFCPHDFDRPIGTRRDGMMTMMMGGREIEFSDRNRRRGNRPAGHAPTVASRRWDPRGRRCRIEDGGRDAANRPAGHAESSGPPRRHPRGRRRPQTAGEPNPPPTPDPPRRPGPAWLPDAPGCPRNDGRRPGGMIPRPDPQSPHHGHPGRFWARPH